MASQTDTSIGTSPNTSTASTVSVVLVTNVGQGFGRAVALAYGQADFDVVCADRDVDLASKTAAEIEELGGQAIPIQADMSTLIDVQNAFEKVFEIFGDLSGVVHVASAESHTRFRDLGEGEFGELVEDTLKSTFLTLKTAARLLSGGWLVLIAPPANALEPQTVAVRGAISRMASGFAARYENLKVNVVIPSRSASDPKHDAPLVKNVLYLGGGDSLGLSGHRFYIKLPPPPRVIESLLPEVRAALDDNVRQDDLEASHFENDYFSSLRTIHDDGHDDGHDDNYDNSEPDDSSEVGVVNQRHPKSYDADLEGESDGINDGEDDEYLSDYSFSVDLPEERE